MRASAPTMTLSSTVILASGPDLLPGADHAEPADRVGLEAVDAGPLEEHVALGGRVVAGDAVEEGGLAGAVGADQPDDLAEADVEADVGVGGEAAEVLGDVLDLEDAGMGRSGSLGRRGGLAGGPRRAASRFFTRAIALRSSPRKPSGAKRTTTTTSTP